MKNTSIKLNTNALKYLDEMAREEGATTKELLEAMLHYMISCSRRPGSWEAHSDFEYSTYSDLASCADRWF